MRIIAAILGGALFVGSAMAAEIRVPVHLVDKQGVGKNIGHIKLIESDHGVVLKPDLRGLPPGERGFHVHEKGSCRPGEDDGKPVAAGAAGDHYDPQESEKHGPPWGDGHKGDLPYLHVAADGTTTQQVMAPRLTLAELPGRALVIHAGGDNYSDHPKPLGGGGDRIACGVIPELKERGE